MHGMHYMPSYSELRRLVRRAPFPPDEPEFNHGIARRLERVINVMSGKPELRASEVAVRAGSVMHCSGSSLFSNSPKIYHITN